MCNEKFDSSSELNYPVFFCKIIKALLQLFTPIINFEILSLSSCDNVIMSSMLSITFLIFVFSKLITQIMRPELFLFLSKDELNCHFYHYFRELLHLQHFSCLNSVLPLFGVQT